MSFPGTPFRFLTLDIWGKKRKKKKKKELRWTQLGEKKTETSQSDRSFSPRPMASATLLSNLSNENVGATIERGERDLYPLTISGGS